MIVNRNVSNNTYTKLLHSAIAYVMLLSIYGLTKYCNVTTSNGGKVVTVVSMFATNWEALVKSGSVGGVPDHA